MFAATICRCRRPELSDQLHTSNDSNQPQADEHKPTASLQREPSIIGPSQTTTSVQNQTYTRIHIGLAQKAEQAAR